MVASSVGVMGFRVPVACAEAQALVVVARRINGYGAAAARVPRRGGRGGELHARGGAGARRAAGRERAGAPARGRARRGAAGPHGAGGAADGGGRGGAAVRARRAGGGGGRAGGGRRAGRAGARAGGDRDRDLVPSDVPDLLAAFHRAHPEVEITLTEANSDELVAAAAGGRARPRARQPRRRRARRASPRSWSPTRRSSRSWRRATSWRGVGAIPLRALSERPVISLPRGTGLRAAFEAACAAAGVPAPDRVRGERPLRAAPSSPPAASASRSSPRRSPPPIPTRWSRWASGRRCGAAGAGVAGVRPCRAGCAGVDRPRRARRCHRPPRKLRLGRGARVSAPSACRVSDYSLHTRVTSTLEARVGSYCRQEPVTRPLERGRPGRPLAFPTLPAVGSRRRPEAGSGRGRPLKPTRRPAPTARPASGRSRRSSRTRPTTCCGRSCG